jgi:hypothetical protein
MEEEAEKDGRGILKGMKVERREGRKWEETERGRKRACGMEVGAEKERRQIFTRMEGKRE